MKKLRTHIGGGGEDMRPCVLGLGLPVRKVASDLRASNWIDGRRPSWAVAAAKVILREGN